MNSNVDKWPGNNETMIKTRPKSFGFIYLILG